MPRINFLFVLIIFLTACTPNTTLASLPTVTSSPAPSVAPTSTAAEVPSIANPISPENMAALTKGGYVWDAEAGVLNNVDGHNAISLQDGKWVDSRTNIATPLESLKPVLVNGIDYQGREIGAVLTREVNGETQIYLPTVDAWAVKMDVLASQALIDRNEIVPTFDNWGDYENITLDELPIVTWADLISGRLFYSEQMALKPWPANVRAPVLQYNRQTHSTVITLSQYQNRGEVFINTEYGPPKMDGRPIVSENDGVRNLDAFKMIDPITGDWMIVKGQQYYYQGHTIVLHLGFGDNLVVPVDKSGAFDITQQSLSNPPWVITEPIVSLRQGDYNGYIDYGPVYDQPSISALQGYGGNPIARDLLPAGRSFIAKFDDTVPTLIMSNDHYPAGAEILKLQQALLPQFSVFNHMLQVYLRPESDPIFKLP